MSDEIRDSMDPLFMKIYADWGRASIPPERLLKAKLLQALYSVRSSRQICDRLETDLLFRDIDWEFMNRIVLFAKARGLVSDEHFSVDGTLIEAWASMKSFRSKSELRRAALDQASVMARTWVLSNMRTDFQKSVSA